VFLLRRHPQCIQASRRIPVTEELFSVRVAVLVMKIDNVWSCQRIDLDLDVGLSSKIVDLFRVDPPDDVDEIGGIGKI